MNKTTLFTGFSLLCAVSASYALNTGEQLSYTGSFYIGNESLRQSGEFIDSKLLGDSGLSAGSGFSDSDLDDDTNRLFEGDFDAVTASIAYIHAFDSVNLGVFGSFVSSNLEVESTGANVATLETDADGWILGVGASTQWEKLSLSAKASFGSLSLDSERINTFGTKDSNYDTTMMNLELLALYELLQNETYALRPFLKLGYTALENDDINEPVSAPDDVAIKSFEDDTPYAEIGVHADYNGFDTIFPFASLSVWQDLGDDEVELETQNGALQADVPDVEQTVFKLKAGVDFMVNEDLSVGASIGYLVGDSIDGVNAGLHASWLF